MTGNVKPWASRMWRPRTVAIGCGATVLLGAIAAFVAMPESPTPYWRQSPAFHVITSVAHRVNVVGAGNVTGLPGCGSQVMRELLFNVLDDTWQFGHKNDTVKTTLIRWYYGMTPVEYDVVVSIDNAQTEPQPKSFQRQRDSEIALPCSADVEIASSVPGGPTRRHSGHYFYGVEPIVDDHNRLQNLNFIVVTRDHWEHWAGIEWDRLSE